MISVVIPCRSTQATAKEVGQQVWYTTASAISNLETLGEPYEIAVIMNGEYSTVASLMHNHPKVKMIFCGPTVDSPQAARFMGAQSTSGETIFFLDAHVVLPPGFFSRILSDMRETGADFMGAAHRFLSSNFYAYHVDWDCYLWGKDAGEYEKFGDLPIMVGIHPHGAFAITREAYSAVGGYWRELRGFGGEETQLCFKLWLMGRTCWITPQTYHWHWLAPGDRRGPEVFKDRRFARNFLAVAAAYSDERQVRDSYDGMQRRHWDGVSLHPELVEEVLADKYIARERESVLRDGKYKNLRELRGFFDREGIFN